MSNFKKALTLILLGIFAIASQSANAQYIEVSPTYGYQFGSKFNYPLGYLKIKDSDMFGITVGSEVLELTMLELSYVNVSTEIGIRDVDLSPQEARLADLSVDLIQLGGTRYFQEGKVQPFAGGALGLAIFSPKNENRDLIDFNLDNSTRFVFSFKAGVLLMVSQRVGLKFQGDLFIPVRWGGVYVGGGTGGVSGGVSLGSTTVLGGLSGGLVFRFGD
jgi:hypothetical protein